MIKLGILLGISLYGLRKMLINMGKVAIKHKEFYGEKYKLVANRSNYERSCKGCAFNSEKECELEDTSCVKHENAVWVKHKK